MWNITQAERKGKEFCTRSGNLKHMFLFGWFRWTRGKYCWGIAADRMTIDEHWILNTSPTSKYISRLTPIDAAFVTLADKDIHSIWPRNNFWNNAPGKWQIKSVKSAGLWCVAVTISISHAISDVEIFYNTISYRTPPNVPYRYCYKLS